MPITIKEFENNEFASNKKELITNFLEKNKNNAFKAKEISKRTGIPSQTIVPYLHALKAEGRVGHKRPYWIYAKPGRKADIKILKISKNFVLSLDEKKLWCNILNLKEKKLSPLADRKKKQDFKIIDATDNFVRIKFLESSIELKLDKPRFLLAYRYLKMNKRKWVKIGASRISTDPSSIEGIIKIGIDGNLNGLSTATWIATLLVKCNLKISFNGQLRNQALMYK